MKGHYSESLHKIDQKSFIHILLPIDRKFRLKKNSNQLIFKIYSFEKIKENEIYIFIDKVQRKFFREDGFYKYNLPDNWNEIIVKYQKSIKKIKNRGFFIESINLRSFLRFSPLIFFIILIFFTDIDSFVFFIHLIPRITNLTGNRYDIIFPFRSIYHKDMSSFIVWISNSTVIHYFYNYTNLKSFIIYYLILIVNPLWTEFFFSSFFGT